MTVYIPPSPYRCFAILCAVRWCQPYALADSPFATRVIEYAPAPGQFINDPNFNDPERALGPPIGGGTSAPSNESVVTLGGFGGYIVLAFDQPVRDDALNPMGLDAIIFSNAYWVGGNPDRHWAECATIEIGRDENQNSLADDAWYLIPGSHIAPPVSPLAHSWNDGSTTHAYALPASTFGSTVVVNPVAGTENEGIYGYAEYSPTLLLGDHDADDVVEDKESLPEDFYTVPDDPFEVGMTAGSGGGDAFDIAWAVDAGTGAPANLEGFDFIRITTPIHMVLPAIGEKSAEIDAVADVAPDTFGDADLDGDIDLADFAEAQICLAQSTKNLKCEPFAEASGDSLDLPELIRIIRRWTGPLP